MRLHPFIEAARKELQDSACPSFERSRTPSAGTGTACPAPTNAADPTSRIRPETATRNRSLRNRPGPGRAREANRHSSSLQKRWKPSTKVRPSDLARRTQGEKGATWYQNNCARETGGKDEREDERTPREASGKASAHRRGQQLRDALTEVPSGSSLDQGA